MVPERITERVLGRLLPTAEGCLESPTAPNAEGYQMVGWSTKGVVAREYVHRVVWESVHGPIPAGMTVHHTCHNRGCGNVEHLELLTRGENAARRFGLEDWPLGECRHGHSRDSMIVRRDGKYLHRRCGECET